MIRHSNTADIATLETLWKTCFPMDHPDFIRFYYRTVYKDDETLVYEEGGRVVAALQIIPYAIKANQAIDRAGYISGAMTHPDHRSKGLMKQLLEEAFRVMEERAFRYTFLIPQKDWLIDYYARFGYERAFPAPATEQLTAPIVCTPNPLILRDTEVGRHTTMDSVDLTDLYTNYHRFLMQLPAAVLKTKEQLKIILTNHFDEGGQLFTNDWGNALTRENNDGVVVTEFFYHDDEIRNLFLQAIQQAYNCRSLTVRDSQKPATGSPQGMIKSLDGNTPPHAVYMNLMLD